MPTVPTYAQPTVAPEELPGAQQQAPRSLMWMADLGPGEQNRVGQQIQGAGAAVAQIDNMEARARANEQDAQGVSAITAIQHDPTNGYMNLRGKAAVDARDGTIQTLQNLGQSLQDQLPDDNSRQMFKQIWQQRLNAATAQIDQHASQQLQQWQLDSSRARQSASAQAAVVSYNPVPGADNTAYKQNVATVHNELESQAQMAGMDPDTSAQYIKAGISSVYASTVQHLLSNNQTQGARAYFDQVRGDMDPALADKIDQQIKGAKDFDDVYTYTDQLQAQHPGDEQAQLKQIASDFQDGTLNGNQRALAEAQVAKTATVQRQAQEQQVMGVLGNVADFAQNNPSAGIQDFGKAFPGQYALLKQSGHLETAINYFDNGGMSKQGDPALFNNLLDMAHTNQKAFLQYPQDDMMARLSKLQFDKVMAARRGILEQSQQQMTNDKLVNDTVKQSAKQLAAAGLNITPKSDSDKQRLGQYFSGLRMELYQAIQNNGGAPISGKQADDIAMNYAKKQTLSGTGLVGFFQTQKAPFEMTDQEKAQPWTVPDDDRQQITAALKAHNIAPTEDNIQRLYKRKFGVQ